jgi:hypothetical protein
MADSSRAINIIPRSSAPLTVCQRRWQPNPHEKTMMGKMSQGVSRLGSMKEKWLTDGRSIL